MKKSEDDIRKEYFSDLTRWQSWLDVESALALVQSEIDIIPSWAATVISKKSKISLINQNELKKLIKEDGHTDVPSAIRKLKTSIEDCQDILQKLEGMQEQPLPSWWSDKITLASNYLNKARDYLLNTEET